MHFYKVCGYGTYPTQHLPTTASHEGATITIIAQNLDRIKTDQKSIVVHCSKQQATETNPMLYSVYSTGCAMDREVWRCDQQGFVFIVKVLIHE